MPQIPLVSSLENMKKSAYVKAFMILVAGPIIPVYFAVSVVNQYGRKLFPCTKTLKMAQNIEGTAVDESKIMLTARGNRQWTEMCNWPWTQVLRSMMVISFVYFGLAVGAGKITVMVLSWLNTQLASTELWLVTLIFVFVGLMMFLLPPVPGVPVYLTGGIILTQASEKVFRPDNDPANLVKGAMSADTTYFWMGICYAIIFSFICKLLAITMQQKLIGGLMGTKVGVRAAIGVNSVAIRAIKLVLEDPKYLTTGKVAILVGGPDWPTSVTTGILGISLVPMLIGGPLTPPHHPCGL